jgi:hypothetical protein
MTTPVEITVVREANTWKIRYGAVELDYETQAEALADAIAIARAFGKAGEFSTVRTGVMTSVYGPEGFIRAVPSGKLSSPAPSTEPKEVPGHGEPKNPFTRRTTPKPMDESSRTSRIASAFDVIRNGAA